MRISVFRKAHFNSAHRLFNPDWTDEKNREIFGICSSPHFHGHNYEVELKVTGELDKESGILIDLRKLKDLLKEKVEDRYDHKNLNVECSEFENKVPSAENLCIEIYQLIRPEIPAVMDIAVRLYETPRNYVEFPA
ncbi:MAG: 6-carboxytetrahydropterin synthase [Saprospiraceae bacterium]|nr:6-carboxytetrahydropterin synthase [Saprospiraceae bacterium]MBK7810384.1 6-carboxytetrahydropterin synthase [Saprospiraceae bacterium]MBK9629985.1 6-carboxytetrahydropterin synthase [Saprospiraceae bacterium]